MKITVTADPKGKPAPAIKFYRGPRELKDDSRVSIRVDGLSSTFGIKRTRLTDEAKYTVNIESEGAITDTATFSVFIKGNFVIVTHCLNSYHYTSYNSVSHRTRLHINIQNIMF